jgi:predicted N-acetyltransferase YhbS
VTVRQVDPLGEPDTVAAMDAVMCAAFATTSFADAMERFATAQPDGFVVAEDGGRVVGTGCCVGYPDAGFGWIGLIATAPGYERRGIATRVTEALVAVLAEHGCASVLDASVKGGPVYERIGFHDRGPTAVLTRPGGPLSPPSAGTGVVCARLAADDLDEIVAHDAVCFGADRRTLLAVARAQRPGRGLVARRDGRVVGYTIAHDPTLAPLVADDAEALHALVAEAVTLPFADGTRVAVPPESVHRATLEALGFEHQRSLRNMRRGIGDLPGRRDRIAGQLSLGEG